MTDLVSLKYNPIQGNNITLRKLLLSDINETYCSWLNDPDTNRYLEARLINWDIEKLRHYYLINDVIDILMAIIDKRNNKHIGNIKLSAIDEIHRRAELGILIGDKDYWGKGVATEAINLATNYCFSKLELHKVTAGAYKENLGSIKAFLKNGYCIEGERKEHFLMSYGWTSLILLGKLKTHDTSTN